MAAMTRFDVLSDREPPNDRETERLLLSALLIAPPVLPGDDGFKLTWVLEKINDGDFYDPFHVFMFRLIKSCRGPEGPDVRRMLAPENKEEAKRLGIDNLAFSIALLLSRRDGSSCCGRVGSIRVYGNHLRMVGYHREKIDITMREYIGAWEGWDEYERTKTAKTGI